MQRFRRKYTDRYELEHAPASVPVLDVGNATPFALCDTPLGCNFVTGPGTVARSSLRVLRRVNAF